MRAAGAERDVVVRCAGDVERSGSANTRSSRFADGVHHHDTLARRDRLAAHLGVGSGGPGEQHHRGDVKRSSSSIASRQQRQVGAEARRTGRAASSSATVPDVMRLRVVSLPAFCSSMKNRSSCIWSRCSPSSSALEQHARSGRPSARGGVPRTARRRRRTSPWPRASRSSCGDRGVEAERAARSQLEHVLAVFLGHADEVGDHVQRQPEREVVDEIALATRSAASR